MTDLDAIRARHVEVVSGHPWDAGRHACGHDLQDWPCDTAIVLAALDEQNAAAFLRPGEYVRVKRERDAAIEREARLRTAVQIIVDHFEGPEPRRGLWSTLKADAARLRAALAPEGE